MRRDPWHYSSLATDLFAGIVYPSLEARDDYQEVFSGIEEHSQGEIVYLRESFLRALQCILGILGFSLGPSVCPRVSEFTLDLTAHLRVSDLELLKLPLTVYIKGSLDVGSQFGASSTST
ncbi:hypothetical protein TorRG33x02_153480 [Trema orientale]|uniref:Uncharacterized protein n=1 Tax=Trema orientale TaxID=63057 RepID=A0A2P5ETG2_TREOI|nr:hypothetical protein TorRG33x02_153480 [Trema orientale]